MEYLKKLRDELDVAITYGEFSLAENIARKGLGYACEQDVKGEIEYFRGQLEILKGNYFEAISCFDRAVKYNPNDGAAFNDRALCMIEMGIVEEAFYYFDKGIEVEPDYATVYHNKGWLLSKVGRYRDALDCFRKALQLQQDRAVTYENIANVLGYLSDYSGALEAYQQAINLLKPEYSDIKKQIELQMKVIEAKMKQ